MSQLRFRVLGPVEVANGADIVPLGPKHRTVLAALLVHANRVVPRHQLIEYLWSEWPPASAVNLVQGYVSELRKTLLLGRSSTAAPPALLTRRPGYMLTVAPDQLDLDVFRARVELAAAEPAPDRAAEALRDALALWRGPAFADVESDHLRERDGVRLGEAWLAATEARIEADLQLGRHHGLIGELSALVVAHPVRERLRAQLMLALYRAGRQVEALDQYRLARRSLVTELGIEPGPELQRLERAILAADSALDALPSCAPGGQAPPRPATGEPDPPHGPRCSIRYPASAPWQLRGGIADFTGRQDVLGPLRALLRRPGNAAAAPVVLISGLAGVGKTTLAVQVAHEACPQFPDGQLHVSLTDPAGEPAEPADVVAGLLRALGVDEPSVPDAVEDRLSLYRTRLACGRVLVLLDDAVSEHQVRPLLPAGPNCAALVTSRARLAGIESSHAIDLDVFDPAQSAELLTKLVGGDRAAGEPHALAHIAALCGHLPLALRIAGARLAAKPHWPLSRLAVRLEGECTRLDELRAGDLDVRTSLARSYHAADPVERAALRRLAVLPVPVFESCHLAELLDCSAATADDLVERLVDRRLLETAGRDEQGHLRYRFHDLLRAYARERLREEEPARAITVGRGWPALLAAGRPSSERTGVSAGAG